MKGKIFYPFLISILLLGACAPNQSVALKTETPEPIAVVTETDEVHVADTHEQDQPLPDTLPQGIELEFWHPWSGEMANLIDDFVDEYNQSNDRGIQVHSSVHADERIFMQDFLTLQAGEVSPDIFAAPPYFLQYLEEGGGELVNLDHYIDSSNWGFPEGESPQFIPLFWDADLTDSKRIAVPAYRTGYFLFLNKTWANELGFEESYSNSSNFQELVCAAARQYRFDDDISNDGKGGLLFTYDAYAIISWLKVFGGGFQDDLHGKNSFQNIDNTQALGYLHDLFFDDCAWNGLNLNNNYLENCVWTGLHSLPYQCFSYRMGIVYSGKLEDIFNQEQVNSINGVLDKWTVIPYPPEDGKPVVLIDGFSYAIRGTDKEKSLAAWDFIRWMLRVENQVKVVETTGSFPLSTDAILLLDDFKESHPAWAESLQHIPLAQVSTSTSSWIVAQDIISDISRRLVQFTTSKEDIAFLLESADILFMELQEE